MKRFLSLVLILGIAMGNVLSLTGCESQKVAILTKGQWAEKIAQALQLDNCEVTEPIYSDVKSDNTYFNAVQNCAAWDIFDKTEAYEPDSEATVNFAIVSAVKAIGADKIAKSSYQKILQTEDEMVDFFKSVSDMDYISGGALYAEWADQIIEDMNTVSASLELQQYQDIGLTENCVEVSASDVIFSADGVSGTLQNDSVTLRKGIILIVNPSELYPEGMAAKIQTIKGRDFTYTAPSMEEVLDHMVLTGTYQPKVIGVMAMSDDVKVEKINGETAVPQRCSPASAYAGNAMYVPKATADKLEAGVSVDDIQFSLMDKKGKKGSQSGSASASVGLKDIKVTADIDMKGLSVKKAYTKIDSTLTADFQASGSFSPETIPLAKVVLTIYKVIDLEFQANLTIGASGEISVNWSLPTTVGVEYKKGAGSQFISEASGSNLKAEAHAEAYAAPGIKGIFKVLSFSVASCGVYSGVQVKLDANAATKGSYSCINLKGYVPLSCFAGGEGEDTLLGKLGAEKSWTIWDEKSSKVKKEWHLENGKLVPKCTHPEEATEAPVEQEEYKKLELPELKFPSFTDFSSTYFGITASFISIKENSSDNLKFSVPDGYSEKDVVCSAEDESVVSVTNTGKITANGAGMTRIKVATKDDKYRQYITVRVIGDYSVEFTPLSVRQMVSQSKAKAC